MAHGSFGLDVLAVLGDPTRRRLFERLAESPAAVGELARTVPVTRSAVSQHLRVLKEAGLVTDSAVGTRRIYRVDPRGIGAIRTWLDRLWSGALADFRDFADDQAETTSKQEEPE